MQGIQSFLPLIIMVAIFYFLLIRPQQKKTKQRTAMLGALKKGDKVVTIGGMHGTVTDLTDDSVTLKVAHNVNITFDRGAVNNVTTVSAETAPSAPAAKETKEVKEEAKD